MIYRHLLPPRSCPPFDLSAATFGNYIHESLNLLSKCAFVDYFPNSGWGVAATRFKPIVPNILRSVQALVMHSPVLKFALPLADETGVLLPLWNRPIAPFAAVFFSPHWMRNFSKITHNAPLAQKKRVIYIIPILNSLSSFEINSYTGRFFVGVSEPV